MDLMTVEQVAAYLQLNKLTVYRYIREGRIPAARIGKSYRIRKADVDAFLESRIAAFKVPARMIVSDGPLPRLGTGKIDRVELKAKYAH